MADRLMTAQEVADCLKLSTSTLATWRVVGEGPPYLKIGRRVRYRQSAVDEWLDQVEAMAMAMTPRTPPTIETRGVAR